MQLRPAIFEWADVNSRCRVKGLIALIALLPRAGLRAGGAAFVLEIVKFFRRSLAQFYSSKGDNGPFFSTEWPYLKMV